MNDREHVIICLGGETRSDFLATRRRPGEHAPQPPQSASQAGRTAAADYKVRDLEARLESILASRTWRLAMAMQQALRSGPARLLQRLRRGPASAPAAVGRALPRSRPAVEARENGLDIVVPVYNGYEFVARLVGSLRCCLPHLAFPVRCIVVDDGSSDPLLHGFYESDPFFDREDVLLLRQPQNRGFVTAANAGLRLRQPGRDALLCNSDIELHPQALHALRELLQRNPKAATATPLTNNGTIASLFNWPHGGAVEPAQARELAVCAAELALPSPALPAPTGVGFCMYMAEDALEATGLLDEDGYSLGYGEENDWCRRAMALGFEHLLCTEAFVPHYETRSFLPEQKRRLIKRNHEILKRRFPDYFPDVEAYVAADPLREHRSLLLLHLALRRLQGAPYVVMALHNDPHCYYGGTERHVLLLAQELAAQGVETFFCYPLGQLGSGELECMRHADGARYPLHEANLPWLQELLAGARALHVHHLQGLEALEALLPELETPKVLTVHDFNLLCPRSNMVADSGVCCQGPQQKGDCNAGAACFADSAWEPQALAARLSPFAGILFPSPNAQQEFLRRGGLEGAAHEPLQRRMQVLPHALPYAGEPPAVQTPRRELLVFLGYASEHKGAAFLRELDSAADAHTHLEIWGGAARPLVRGVVRSYQSWRELQALARREKPGAVLLPALWPETFSYTLYEALFLLGVPLIVGPMGNPAELVAAHGLGVVMERVDMAAFQDARQRLLQGYDGFLQNVRDYGARHAAAFTPEGHAAAYVASLRRAGAQIRERG